jgi:co-chaperonin GroES (HSP10)|tara:strand:+ start:143 stop:517 length:375 start_codon:yes stop_codon:yes gene_type:complete
MTKTTNIKSIDDKKATQLPQPQGYHILCAVPDIEEKFDSGLLKASETQKTEEILATVLFVVELGPDCYGDTNKFPTGPWCKKGDFILVRPHTGTRLHIHGKAFRIINDDSVEAVVEDPRGIQRQ